MVEPQGLAGDRRWMLVDERGRCLTARDQPSLVLVSPEPTGPGLRLSAPGMPRLEVSRPVQRRSLVRIWGAELEVTVAAPEAADWFSSYLRQAVRLVHQHDPAGRPVDPDYSSAEGRVSLADGFPVLLAAEESVAAVNGWIAAGPYADEAPIDARRFRPNVMVSGAGAWAEDGWRRVRIGATTFRVAKPCSRCVLTTIDPDTAVKGREPLATLARHRRRDGAVQFGVNLIPEDPGGTLRVGDRLEVVEG